MFNLICNIDCTTEPEKYLEVEEYPVSSHFSVLITNTNSDFKLLLDYAQTRNLVKDLLRILNRKDFGGTFP
jgi:hypothetical protein